MQDPKNTAYPSAVARIFRAGGASFFIIIFPLEPDPPETVASGAQYLLPPVNLMPLLYLS